MNLEIYRYIHFAGILISFLGFGLLIARAMLNPDNKSLRKQGMMFNGIGLFLVLLGGFGMLARGFSNEFPWWVIVKIIIWVALGGLAAAINYNHRMAKVLMWITLALGLTAAYLGTLWHTL